MSDRTEGGGVADQGIHSRCAAASSIAPANTTWPYSATVSGELKIGAFVPLSTTDLPGQLASVVFCQGCPWRCAYCHNPHLQPAQGEALLDWHWIVARLERRRGLIDAVVFSGGEPTAQGALPYALQEVRRMGFGVGLHTAGMYPRRLRRLLPLTDWVGFDVKTSFADYGSVTGVAEGVSCVVESVRAVVESGVECEFRTTVHPDLIQARTLRTLAATLARLGVKRYVLQEFRAQGCPAACVRRGRSLIWTRIAVSTSLACSEVSRYVARERGFLICIRKTCTFPSPGANHESHDPVLRQFPRPVSIVCARHRS